MFHSPKRVRESGGEKDLFDHSKSDLGGVAKRRKTVFGPNRDGSETAFSSENAHTKTILHSYNGERSIRRRAPLIFRTRGRHCFASPRVVAHEMTLRRSENDLGFQHIRPIWWLHKYAENCCFSFTTKTAPKPHFRQRTTKQQMHYTRTTRGDLSIGGLR